MQAGQEKVDVAPLGPGLAATLERSLDKGQEGAVPGELACLNALGLDVEFEDRREVRAPDDALALEGAGVEIGRRLDGAVADAGLA